jgi:hypothetical protein
VRPCAYVSGPVAFPLGDGLDSDLAAAERAGRDAVHILSGGLLLLWLAGSPPARLYQLPAHQVVLVSRDGRTCSCLCQGFTAGRDRLPDAGSRPLPTTCSLASLLVWLGWARRPLLAWWSR